MKNLLFGILLSVFILNSCTYSHSCKHFYEIEVKYKYDRIDTINRSVITNYCNEDFYKLDLGYSNTMNKDNTTLILKDLSKKPIKVFASNVIDYKILNYSKIKF